MNLEREPKASLDIAYAAGLFEGEGSVKAQRSYQYRDGTLRVRSTPTVALRMAMTDRGPLERMVRIFGGKVNGPYHRGENRKDVFEWTLSKRELVDRAIEALLPWMSPRRQRQLCEAFGQPYAWEGRRRRALQEQEAASLFTHP